MASAMQMEVKFDEAHLKLIQDVGEIVSKFSVDFEAFEKRLDELEKGLKEAREQVQRIMAPCEPRSTRCQV